MYAYPDLAASYQEFYPEVFLDNADPKVGLPTGTDPRLVNAWRVMKTFSMLVNRAGEAGRSKLTKETMLDVMASLMYRLIIIREFSSGSLDETIRLSLLTFAATVFLQWREATLSYCDLSGRLKASLEQLDAADVSPRLLVWIFTMGAILLGKQDHAWLKPWLRLNMNLCGVKCWADMRRVLKSSMWVDVALERMGKGLFEKIGMQASH